MTLLRWICGLLVFLAIGLATAFASGSDAPSFGPAMILLGVAGILGIFVAWKEGSMNMGSWLLAPVGLGFLYFIMRGYLTPVELGFQQDAAFLSAGMVLYGVGFAAARRTTGLTCIWLGLVLWFLLNLATICYQAWAEPAYSPFLTENPEAIYRMGWFGYFNYFGSFCGLIAVASSAMAICVRNQRVLSIFVAILGWSGVIFSQSRGALIASAVGVTVVIFASILLSWRVRKKQFPVFLIAGTSLFAGLVAVAVIFAQVIGEKRFGSSDNFFFSNSRFEMIQVAHRIWQESPIFGHGSRMFGVLSTKYWEASGLPIWNGKMEYVHNEYAQALSDYGTVGLALLLLIFISHLIAGVCKLSCEDDPLKPKSKSDPEQKNRTIAPSAQVDFRRGFLVACLSAIVFSAVHSIFDLPWHISPCWMVAALAGGLLGGASLKSAYYKPGRIWFNRILWILLIVPASLFLISEGIPQTRILILERQAFTDHKEQFPLACVEKLDKITKISPNWLNLRALGHAQISLGRKGHPEQFPLAKDSLLRSYELNPYDVVTQTFVGEAYDELNEFEQAEPFYDSAAKTSPHAENGYLCYLRHSIHLARWADFLWKKKRDPWQARKKLELSKEKLDFSEKLYPSNNRLPEFQQTRTLISAQLKFFDFTGIEGDGPDESEK